MSRPPNRLANFRSYSYYHVLAMCDSSETAQALAASSDLKVWEHTTSQPPSDDDRPFLQDLGKYAPRKLKDAGKYVILINGSTDAAFAITSAKWTTATGATATPDDRSTSLAVEGSIQISEPKGVAFLDQVVKCAVALGVDGAQVYYVMKTFFIGFRDDGLTSDTEGNRYDFISDIPPIVFIVYDVTGAFTEAGGQYTMEFVAAAHGASRLPQYSKAVQSMSVTAGDSLEQTLKRLQDNINKSYNQYFDCVYEQVRSMSQGNQDVLNSLRRVKYQIEVGDAYTDADGIKYTVTNQAQQQKNTPGCNDPATITFPSNMSIESAIRTIMQMCPQVQADMSVGDGTAKYEFKIHTGLLSRQAEGERDGVLEYTVYYRVERFLTPKTISYSPAFAVLQEDISPEQAENDPNFQLIKRNIIEFDYLYTGQNVDILDFEMNVNMGMAYIQTATLANSFKSQLQRAQTRTMHTSNQDLNNHLVRYGSPVQTPVFFGSTIRTPVLQNSVNPTDAIETAYTLTKHSSVEVLDVTMRILGNTKLLGSTNSTTSPEVVAKNVEPSPTVTTPLSDEATFTDWTFVPAYVRVNIKMPRNNDDFLLYSGQGGDGSVGSTDYARQFWFDGYYYVVGIEHVFENGEFTQVLSMVGLPKRSAFQTAQTAPSEVSAKSDVGTCFDNQIGAGPSPGSPPGETPSEAPPARPHTPPSGSPEPTNRPDADTANRTARSPSDVKGWDNASPEVKRAIEEAAKAYNVDVVVMAQFAAKESSFRAQATAAPRSSATGLYQFLQGTWNGLVKQGKVIGTTQLSTQQTHQGSGANWSQPLPSDPRMNPQLNANAGAAFLRDNIAYIGSSDAGDLYLAHFLGPAAARKVITRDNATGGTELLTVSLSAETVAQIARANPTIVRPNTTVGEIRTWAAMSMAKLLKNPIPNARQTTPTTAVTQTTPGSAQVSPSPQPTTRTANQSVAAVQNARVQDAKRDTQPCTPIPNKIPQDRPRGGQ